MTSGSSDPRKTETVPASPLRTSVSSGTAVPTGTIIPATREPDPDPIAPDAFRIGGHVYRVLSTLSRSTGEAVLYIVETKRHHAVAKQYRLQGKTEKLPLLEVVRRLRKKDLIEIIDAGIESGHLVEVMAHAGGGTLRDLKPFRDPLRLCPIIVTIAGAIDALHRAGVVHCDVKPENVLFMHAGPSGPVLADFGIAEFLDCNGKATTEKKGSPLYAAPEAHAVAENMIRVYPASDWYSLGITILDVWSAESPFPFSSELDLLEAKLQGRIVPPADMPEDLRQLVSGLLFPIADSRWGYDEVCAWARGGTPDLPRVETGSAEEASTTGGAEPQQDPVIMRPPGRIDQHAAPRPTDGAAPRSVRQANGTSRPVVQKRALNLPLVLCAGLAVVALLSTGYTFPSDLSDLNPLLVPSCIVGGTAGVWLIQRGEQGRFLSALVAGPISGVVGGIAAFWIVSVASRVPLLTTACCVAAGAVMVLRGLPGRGGRIALAAAFGALLATYLLHMPPVSTLTQFFSH